MLPQAEASSPQPPCLPVSGCGLSLSSDLPGRPWHQHSEKALPGAAAWRGPTDCGRCWEDPRLPPAATAPRPRPRGRPGHLAHGCAQGPARPGQGGAPGPAQFQVLGGDAEAREAAPPHRRCLNTPSPCAPHREPSPPAHTLSPQPDGFQPSARKCIRVLPLCVCS